MKIESLSVSKYKNKDKKFMSEDCVVAIDSKILAVFDGATTNSCNRINGKTLGAFASSVAAETVIEFRRQLDYGLSSLNINHLQDFLYVTMRMRYEEACLSKPFPATTAAIVLIQEAECHFLIIGDTSIRINGANTYSNELNIDKIWIQLRVLVFNWCMENFHGDKLKLPNGDSALLIECEKLSRRVIFKGLAGEDVRLVDYIQKKIVSESTFEVGKNETNLVFEIMLQGITKIQSHYANSSDSKFGYAILNGDPINGEIKRFSMPINSVETVEIFSDGYLAPPSSQIANFLTVEAWEHNYFEIENIDPYHIHEWPAIKSAMADEYYDDRSIVIAKF